MKTYKTIDDAIYEVADKQIVKRRRNPAVAVVVLAIGFTVMAIGYFGTGGLPPSVSSAMMLTGFVFAFAGFVKTIIDLSDKGRPYYKPSGEKLHRYELIFDMPYLMKVCECVNDGDLDALAGLPHGRSASVTAVIYKTAHNEVAMTQAFDHAARKPRPLTETKMFEKGQFVLTGKLGPK